MKQCAKASSAASIQTAEGRRARIGLACLAMLGLVAFLGISASSASAIDTCPNVVFRTGPSAKLPECRAYELVSPVYTGGKPPTFESFLGDLPGMFATNTVTSAGDSVVYHTFNGALSGFSGTGYVDRYRAKRTAQGWVTESISPGGDLRASGIDDGPGGISSDHEYAAEGAFEPTPELLGPAFPGPYSYMQILRTPSGYEPLAQGSLGVDSGHSAEAYWITAGGTHVIFGAKKKLEPAVSTEFTESDNDVNLYDRTPGGPTHVVSLLPDETSPPDGIRFLGATKDGTEVAFEANGIYVRRNNAVTEQVLGLTGVVVGKKLKCVGGPEGATLAYQWLRNGAATGITTPTYTTTAADEGSVVQCQVTASNSEGTSIQVSKTRVVEPYEGKTFPTASNASIDPQADAVVGAPLTCSAGSNSGFTLTYKWLKDGSEIGGATSATYTPVEADAGSSLQCRVTVSNANGTSVAYSFLVSVVKAAPKASANPAISNVTDPGDSTPDVGDELSCSEGTWSGSPTLAYQWLRNGAATGTTTPTYTTAAADEGKTVQCRVTATNSGGSTQAVSDRAVVDPRPGEAPPQQTFAGGVFGTAKVGNELFCGEGGWEGTPSFEYQWLKNGTEIGGATSFSYTLTSADANAVVQCRLTATNAGGATVAINANEGVKVVTRAVPAADASLRRPDGSLEIPGFTFDGIFNHRVFYSDVSGSGQFNGNFGNLYMYDLDAEETTTIAGSDDASIVNVSEDASHVYFLAKSALTGSEQNQYGDAAVPPAKGTGTLTSEDTLVSGVSASEGTFQPGMAISGEGIPSQTTIEKVGAGTITLSKKATASGSVSLSANAPNLYVWSRADESTKFIATVAQEDVETGGKNGTASINTWAMSIATSRISFDRGPAMSHTRSTADGTIFAFESTAQLSDFDNTEENAADCGRVSSGGGLPIPGQGCDEVYRYDATSGDLTCVSCSPGTGPASGEARLQSINMNGGTEGVAPATPYSPVESLTADGKMVFFESTEGIVPQDGNETKDVYRWKEGGGVALISTGQGVGESALYGVTPNGSDAIFGTREKLLPQDENGTTVRLYDARVLGGFPPPEETVTEPCSGDACQGQAAAAPEPPNVSSSSLSGQGNVAAKLKCAKHSRRVVRKGRESCRRKHTHRRAHHKRRAAR